MNCCRLDWILLLIFLEVLRLEAGAVGMLIVAEGMRTLVVPVGYGGGL